MYTTPRSLVSGRIPEFLENLKAEFETLAHELNMYKMQKDEWERKLQAQLGELNNIQQTLFDLERNHNKIKQQYEEEIHRLRRQLELSGGGNVLPYGRAVSPPPQGPPLNSRDSISQRSTDIRPPTTGLQGEKGILNNNPMQPPNNPWQQTLPLDKKTFVPPPPNPPKRGRDEFFPGSSAPALPQPPSENTNGTHPNKQFKPGPLNTEPEEGPHRKTVAPRSSENGVKEEDKKQTEEGGVDWIVGYNPGVQTSINIDLMHNLEHSSVVCCVKFSNDGKCIATGCNKSAQIYDVESGEKIHTFSEDTGKDGDLYIRSVCFSPDNRFLAAGAEDKTVKVWDIEQKRLRHTFTGHELDIYSLDYSKCGNFIVSGSGDKTAKIWDVEKGERLFTLGNEEVGPKDGVTSVAFSPDGRLVAAGSLDRIVRLWDAQTGYFLERYEGHLDSVYSVAFSPDGKSLASGSLDKTLKLWDLSGSRSRSRCRSTFSGHKDFVLSVAFSPDGNWVISGSKDRSVQFWDPRSAVTHMMLQGHKNSVISVAVSPSGNVLATGSGDFRARVWKYD